MALGKEHDKTTSLLSFPFGLILGIFVGFRNGLIGGVAFLIGGLWLSPDLDTQSRALKRWGYFKFIWWPYTKMIRHRSFLSHSPIIGSFIRILYLSSWIMLLILLIKSMNIESIMKISNGLIKNITNNRILYLSIIIGIEGSAWLHLLQDGDPLPIEWKKIISNKK